MRTKASVVIDRPIEDVFRMTSENVAEWNFIVVENIDLETTPEKIGSTFRYVTENEGRRMEFDGVVTRHDPPHLNTTQMTGESFDVEVEYRFEVLADRTRVTEISQVTPKGIWLVIFFLFGWLLKSSSCAAAQEALDNLKVLCEQRGARA